MFCKCILVLAIAAIAHSANVYQVKKKEAGTPNQYEAKGFNKQEVIDFENMWCQLFAVGDVKGLEKLYADEFYYAEKTKIFTTKKEYLTDFEQFLKNERGHKCEQEFLSVTGCEDKAVVVGIYYDIDPSGKKGDKQFFVDVLNKNEEGKYVFHAESLHMVYNQPPSVLPADKLVEKPAEKPEVVETPAIVKSKKNHVKEPASTEAPLQQSTEAPEIKVTEEPVLVEDDDEEVAAE